MDEVEIIVKAIDKTGPTFAAINARARGANAKIKVEAEVDDVKFTSAFRNIETRARSILGRVVSQFAEAGGKAASAMSSAVDSGLKAVGPVAIAALAPLGGMIAAALSAGILLGLAGGVIGIGALILKENPQVQKAAEQTGKTISDVLTRAAQPLVPAFTGALEQVGDWFKENEDIFTKMFETVAPYVETLTTAFLEMAEKALPGIQKGLEGAAPLIDVIAEKAPEMGQAIGDFFAKLSENENASRALSDVLDIMIKLVDWTGDAIVAFSDFWVWFTDGWEQVFEDAKPPAEKFWAWWSEGWTKAFDDAKPVVDGFFDWLIGTEDTKLGEAHFPLDSFWEWFYGGWENCFASATAAITGFWNWFVGGWSGVFSSAMAAISGFFNWFISGWAGVFNDVRGALSSFWSWFTSGWAGVYNSARSALSSFLSWCTSTWRSLMNAITSAVNGGRGAVVAAFNGVINSARSAIQGSIPSFSSVGSAIINGIRNGIMNAAGSLASAAANAARNALNAAKAALGINSPSRVFAKEVGEPITEGMAVGITRTVGRVTKAVTNMTDAASATARSSVDVDAFGGRDMEASATSTMAPGITVQVFANGSIMAERDLIQTIRDAISQGSILKGVQLA